ncbi:MAG: sarcosine oxidase subunit delta [Rhodospirillales bacterium]|jgi:heterotetrameric sarcosine oxidase delta subunit|nr:sarcosine oxidase subunit delta [Rhodospirillales bacterium]MBT4040976.1 sarcosine oxidase subunit delta [Rhodospirillales bacterium]MBT4625622.1 sarcosine oxidase subunit delta [Rhodospirillales bacterium]MBT5350209.1 sarcosine oxidase subunit delta [Rhodospirillales bacterium]MBT5522009.1 sarcosine oxidase subunit delta [Rhodospirillales bacterium]
MLIKCPWCGDRALQEFSYQGDATVQRPAEPAEPTDAKWDDEWYQFVYLRDDPKGWHDELWQHNLGCRKHFKARRNTVTHEIADTGPMNEELKGGDK